MIRAFIIFILVAIAVVGGFFIFNNYIYNEKQADTTVPVLSERDVSLRQFTDESVQISFDYPEGPDGYVVDDLSEFIGEEPQGIEVVKVFRIINVKDKFELENSEGGREGPPVIQLMVFRNDLNQSASMWVDEFPIFSNINMVMGEVDRDAVVGGANAVTYTTDGLYVTDNVAIASGGFIYHFTGSYLAADAVIRQDFKGVVDSVRFVSATNEGAGAKIDVRVACESALAYMLFETGEKADQFVAECINGEHPEVIDRYIESLNLDSATI